MKLAIMQPYFFPYIGYFQLINAVDHFVLLNEVQYIRHGWINRNRILKPLDGIQYIIVPLSKYQQKSTINEIQVSENSDWKFRILRQIEHYRRKAPFFKQILDLLEESFQSQALSITDLNEYFLKKVCNYIGIGTNIVSSSAMNFDYTAVKEKDDWALTICEQLKASEYINPVGGMELFRRDKFSAKEIKLSFLKPNDITYSQCRNFEPNLSIIDVMMFNEPKAIQSMLMQYQIV